jgi:hypothetical protein
MRRRGGPTSWWRGRRNAGRRASLITWVGGWGRQSPNTFILLDCISLITRPCVGHLSSLPLEELTDGEIGMAGDAVASSSLSPKALSPAIGKRILSTSYEPTKLRSAAYHLSHFRCCNINILIDQTSYVRNGKVVNILHFYKIVINLFNHISDSNMKRTNINLLLRK